MSTFYNVQCAMVQIKNSLTRATNEMNRFYQIICRMVGYAVMEPNGRTDTNESDPVTDYDPNIEPCQDSGFTGKH